MTLEPWHLITFLVGLLITFLAFSGGVAKFVLAQIIKQLDERFRAQETARTEAAKHWDTKFAELKAAGQRDSDRFATLEKDLMSQLSQLERDLLKLKVDLPNEFVRREDWIRFAAVIDAKQDALSEKMNTLNARLAGLLEKA